MSRRRISWSELPSELLTPIYDHLHTQTDICSFPLVCRAWRASTSFSTLNKPLNLLSPLLPYKFSINDIINRGKFRRRSSLTLVPCSVFLVQSLINNKFPPWICAVKEFTPGKFHGIQGSIHKDFNFAFFRVSEMGRFYMFELDDDFNWHRRRLIGSKVCLISNPKFGSLVEIDDYKAVVLDNDGTLHMISIENEIIDILLGVGNKMCDDMINFQENVFAIDRKGRLYRMGYNDSKFKMVVPQPVGEGSKRDMKKRLVVDTINGELYLVHRTPAHIKSTFKVYKMNFKSKRWDEVAGIGVGRILVVICNRCFITTTKYIPGLGGNCIIFHDDDFPAYNYALTEKLGMSYTCLYSFRDGSCKDMGKYLCQFFWQPPPWLSADIQLLKSLSIREMAMVRDFCNHVISESRCTKETCVAKAILRIKDEHQEIQEMQRVARDHIRRMPSEHKQKMLKLKRLKDLSCMWRQVKY